MSYELRVFKKKIDINLNLVFIKLKWLIPLILIISTVFITKSNKDFYNIMISYFSDKYIENNYYEFEDVIAFQEPNSLIDVKIDTLGEKLPTTKEEGGLPVLISFNVNGVPLNTYGEIKVQGTSTAAFPKKNWSLTFYKDSSRTKKLNIKVGDSVPSDKWVIKADWNDPTLLRNALSFGLWGSMVNSRTGFPKNEVDNAFISSRTMYEINNGGAQGYPKVHPLQLRVNGKHYGLSLLVLGHDPKNFNIDKNNPNHIYMEFDARGGYTLIKTWEKFSAEGIGEWIDSYMPKDNKFSKEQIESIDSLGKFINSPLNEFKENFDTYLDKTNMIDKFLFLEMIYDYDAVAQDIEMVTYDLKKWYMLPWDKDTTFGMSFDETGVIDESATTLLFNYAEEMPDQIPWFKLYHSFRPEIEKRYAQLRNKNVFSVENLYNMAEKNNRRIPKEVWKAEISRWKDEGRPSLDETNTYQIMFWFKKRLSILDQHFNYNP